VRFEEFENTLQDWLDEGRLDEVETLIPLVCEADRAQCEELLFTYHALFAGLNHTSAVETSSATASPSVNGTRSRWKEGSLPAMAIGLALCLTLMATMPGIFSEAESTTPLPSQALVTSGPQVQVPPAAPALEDLPEVSSSVQIASREPALARFATASLEPLARSMASRTDLALKSINRVAIDLNPIDEQLAAYQDAAPLIDTLTRGLLPGTHSLGNAFSVLHETAAEPAPAAQEQDSQPLSVTSEKSSIVS